ncbi:MAG: DNA mismatch repair endonuclease MutL [SAR202 cluster bacterium]|nr:DNA mismatch repair endonuclease MutL [SAR202 cluster bacterium]
MPIRLLSPDISSKIAAGEVTERPASVVKELVENSLDAGATKISIDIKGGGIDYIRVSDNGSGIPAAEAPLAFERFATSKLASADDLESIATLGFRGEALPSIAAVSQVTMVTRVAEEAAGVRLELADGRITAQHAEGAPVGTSVTARNLFRSFPARRKFLRTPGTEGSRVQAVVVRFVLAYPGVSFHLAIDGSPDITSTGSGSLREAITAVYGAKVAEAMIEVTDDGEGDSPVRVSGMIGSPAVARSNRTAITVFVNGRWVQNKALTYAVEESYRGFLMEHRFPVAVINLSVPYPEIDVNVHPAKSEVRFLREGSAFATLQKAVRAALTANVPVPEVRRTSGPTSAAYAPPTDIRSYWQPPVAQPPGTPASEPAGAPAASPGPRPEQLLPKKALPALRVLGQVQNTYITAEGPDGMYLIDQHAAHERVLFERVRAENLARSPRVQGLMEPVTVDLDPRKHEIVAAHIEVVSGLGYQIESFGGRSWLIRGVPAILKNEDATAGLLEVLDMMAEGGGYQSWEDRAAYSIACHGAIRAGKTLTAQEMSEMVRLLEQCQQPHTCPHGRPTMVHMSSARLEQEFGRRG